MIVGDRAVRRGEAADAERIAIGIGVTDEEVSGGDGVARILRAVGEDCLRAG